MSYPPNAGGPSPWAAAASPPAPPRDHGSRTVLLVLLGVAGVMTLLCCGMGGLAYFAVQQAIQPAQEVALPQRNAQDAADVSDLVQALQRPGTVAHPQEAAIRRWLASQVARAERGGSVAPEADLFYAAVLSSPEGKELNLLQQAQLRNSLQISLPEPSVLQHYTVLEIAAGAAPNTARVSIVFYEIDRLPSLQHWFLVHTAGQWQLYDWFDADPGRRRSDEYAHYFRHVLDNRAEGYDRVIELVNGAYAAAGDDDPEKGRQLLRQAEQVACLPADRDRALLEIGRAYQTLGDHAAAAGVFERGGRPQEVTGIWASLAVSHLALDDPRAALRSAGRLRTIYANHPAADYIAANAVKRLDLDDKAVTYFLRYLALCPDDAASFEWLLAAQPVHAADIVRIVQRSETGDEYLAQLFDFHIGDREMLTALDTALAESDATPPLWRSLSNILLQHASGDVSDALQQLAALGADGGMSEAFTQRQEDWLVTWSIEQGDASPLRQHQAFERLMRQGAEAIVWEELYPEPAQVEAAMAALGEADQQIGGVAAMRVWAAWAEDRHEDVVTHGFTYLDASPDPAGDHDKASDEANADQALRDEVAWRVNDSLTRLGRFEEALDRFGQDPQHCWDLLTTLFLRRDAEGVEEVRRLVADSDLPTAPMALAAIDATLADWQGSAETADRHWVACLNALDAADQQSYVFDAVARQRGATAARLRHPLPLIGDPTVPGWNVSVRAICREVMTLLDVGLMREVESALSQLQHPAVTAEGEEPLPEVVWRMCAEIGEQEHDWSSAAAYRQHLLDAADPDSWAIDRLREQWLAPLLRMGPAADQRIFHRLRGEDDALWASYHIARGSTAVVCDHLEDLTSDQRGQWFTSPMNRPYVLHNRDLIECLSADDIPLSVSYVAPIASMVLIEQQYRALDARQLRAMAAALRGGEVTEVTSGIDPATQTRWTIHTPGKFYLVLTAGRGSFATHGLLPAAADEALSQSSGYVTIEVYHSMAIPAHRLVIALASDMATESTRLVYDDRSQYAWYGDTHRWSDRLEWDNRLRIDDQSAAIGYLYLKDADAEPRADVPTGTQSATQASEPPASGQAVTLEWLQTQLAARGQSQRVMLEIPSRYGSERLAVVPLAIDSESEQVDVQLRENSALLPTLQVGQRLLVHAHQLTQP